MCDISVIAQVCPQLGYLGLVHMDEFTVQTISRTTYDLPTYPFVYMPANQSARLPTYLPVFVTVSLS